MVDYLQSSANFKYDADVRDLACEGLSTVECFARYRHGYCQYYATTMAILLRQHGIPTRLAAGFLPGERDDSRLFERVSVSAAHAWVEVYFPGYGWVEFDPTGGGLAAAEPLPTGEPVPTAAPGSSSSPGLGAIAPPFIDDDTGPGTTGGGSVVNAQATGGLIVVALLLLIAVGSLAFVAYRRGPRGEVTPDKSYAMITRLAGRLGFGPRPTQTVYEYAGALGEMLPAVAARDRRPWRRPRSRSPTAAGCSARTAWPPLREAHRRLRVGLLRLMLRRMPRGAGASRRRR